MSGTADVASPPRAALLVIAVGLGIAAGPLDTSVNVAFPAIVGAFRVQVDAVQWVVVSYVLTYSSLLLGFGRMADLFGHRRVFIVGIVWSMLALAGCASALRFEWFLLARAAQGVGTAMLLSTGAALLTLSFPESARTRVLALYALAFSIANAVGPLAGGMLVDRFGWSSVFWFRVPVLALALAGTLAFIRVPPMAREPGDSFDWIGAGTLIVAVLTTMAALNRLGRHGLTSILPWLLAGVAIVAVLAFVRHALRASHPIMDLRLFRHRTFAAANLTHVLVNSASFMIMLLVPFYLARAVDGDARLIGLLLATYPLGAVVASLLARRALERAGAGPVSQVGLACAAAGLAGIALWPGGYAPFWIAATLALHGFGYGLFQVAAVDVVMAAVPRSQHGVGGSLNMLTRTLGVVAGASIGSIVFTALGGASDADAAVYRYAHGVVFGGAAVLVVLSMALLAWLVTRSPPSETVV